MSNRSTPIRLFAVALFAVGIGVSSAQAAESSGKAGADAKAAAKERAKGSAATSMQALIKELNQRRELLIADHDALAKRLKEATEEEKKAIKEKMEAHMKAFETQQKALHKQIRDEQRRQRKKN